MLEIGKLYRFTTTTAPRIIAQTDNYKRIYLDKDFISIYVGVIEFRNDFTRIKKCHKFVYKNVFFCIPQDYEKYVIGVTIFLAGEQDLQIFPPISNNPPSTLDIDT